MFCIFLQMLIYNLLFRTRMLTHNFNERLSELKKGVTRFTENKL